MNNINLIPQEEIQLQQKGKAVQGTTIFFILLTVVTLGVSGYFYYKNTTLTAKNNSLTTQIEAERTAIKSLSETEVILRNLDKKYNFLSGLINGRLHYSKLLTELKTRQPEGINVEALDVKAGSLNYTGNADNYVLIANFINSLLNKDFPGGDSNLKELFTEVKLNSVTLDQNRSTVRFFIVINYYPEKIKL